MATEKAHHEILCAAIQEKRLDRQAPTEATLHNPLLSIINHRSGDVLVPQKFLNRSDVVAVVQQVGRKRMSKRVWASRFRDLRFEPGLVNGLLENRFVEVVAPLFSCDRIGVMAGGWKHPLPSPVPTRAGILSV